MRDRLREWLSSHAQRLERFRVPLPVAEAAREVGIPTEALRKELAQAGEPLYHLWPHTHAGRTAGSKPYCLRINGPDTLGLDWEDSVVGAAEAEFQRRGYQTERELGTRADVEALLRRPDLSRLRCGVNQRDLWALRADGRRVQLWIIEAKGKEAYGFEHYCFAETLGQIFPFSGETLSALLGSRMGPGHGLCWTIAQALLKGWESQRFEPTITIAAVFPLWRPDVVWSNGKARVIAGSCFDRPLAAFEEFIETGRTAAHSGRFKYERAFGLGLEQLEADCQIRRLCRSTTGLRFRILTALTPQGSTTFELRGVTG